MKDKTKEFLKKYLIGFVLGIVSACTISVIAATYFPSNDVTYDNSESGLSSTNVQGAIDELYGVCFPKPAGDQIIEGAGLEKDEYECRYFFTGANPNNYITFNDEKAGWRIISVECDGTIKIMRTADIKYQYWNTYNSNNWLNADVKDYLNGEYYNNLNSTAQSQVVAKDWSIGYATYNDTPSHNLVNTINDENSKKWNGKVALITASEYIRSNSNKNECGTTYQIYYNKSGRCKGTTWIHNSSDSFWTLTPFDISNSEVFYIQNTNGYFIGAGANNSMSVKPTIYLSSDIKLSGRGTQSNPYTIE